MSLTRRLLPIAGITGLIALSACGTSTATSSGGGGVAGCHGTVTVATDLPLTGGDATDGPFPQMAAALAVEQANANKVLGGCTLKYVSKDDSSVLKNGHDPAQGAQNVAALASDSSVVGVIGPFNSSVAKAEIPQASLAHLALISPANTNPCLTAVVDVCSDPTVNIDTASLYKGPHTYFRVIANDVIQGKIDAFVAFHELSLKKVYVIDDQESYGRGLALLFQKAFTAAGGTIVASTSLPGATTTFATQMSEAKSKGADFIYFGGTTGNGCGLVRRDMGAAGLNIPLLGGDGCQDTKFIKDANSGANVSEADGMEATSAPDATPFSSAAKFYADYAARYASLQPPYNDGKKEPYSPFGYDAMNILIQAIKAVVTANNGQLPSDPVDFRDKVVAQLHNTSFDGALGHTSFDANGDTTNPFFTLYKVSSGAWTAVKTYVVDTSGNVAVKS
jgi:branched-chain amino acid transport system substrate-binding protein